MIRVICFILGHNWQNQGHFTVKYDRYVCLRCGQVEDFLNEEARRALRHYCPFCGREEGYGPGQCSDLAHG